MPKESRTEFIQFCDKSNLCCLQHKLLYEQAYVYGLFILSSIPIFRATLLRGGDEKLAQAISHLPTGLFVFALYITYFISDFVKFTTLL